MWVISPAVRLRLLRPDLFTGFTLGTSALHIACFCASWEVVEALLDMGMDPSARATSGASPLTYASFHSRADTVTKWMERFPTFELDRMTEDGGNALTSAVMFGPDKLPTIKAMVEAGANVLYRIDNGSHILHHMAANIDMDFATAQYILNLAGVRERVDVPMRAMTRKWWLRFKASRLLVKLGNKKLLLRVVSTWEGLTPLGSAARNGNTVVIEVLARDGGADPMAKNAQGLTALELARRVEGKQYYHPLLANE